MNDSFSLLAWTPPALLLIGLALQMVGVLLCWLVADAPVVRYPMATPAPPRQALPALPSAERVHAFAARPGAAAAHAGRPATPSAIMDRDAA